MSVSLDGYIADESDFLGGDDGERLHEWFEPRGGLPESVKGLVEEINSSAEADLAPKGS